MTRPAIQLYTLRDVERPFTEILELVADAGFEGVEFAFRVSEADPAEVVTTLDETGLEVAGAHVGIDRLERDLGGTVGDYDALGCNDIVVPRLDAGHFESRAAVGDAADRVAALDADLAERGTRLHYHNHSHEYAPLDDGTGFDAFVGATDVGIELDLGLALFAGDDPVARLRSLGERARLVHLKDYDVDAGTSVPVGEGDLDLPGVADAVRECDSDWLIYEYEGDDPVASIADAAGTVRDLC